MVLGEPAFGFDGGLTTHAGGRDRLAENVIRTIARDVDAGDVGLHLRSCMRLEVTAFIHLERRGKRPGVGNMADGNKDAFDG